MLTESSQSKSLPAAASAFDAAAVRDELAQWRLRSEKLLPALGLQDALLAEVERTYRDAAEVGDREMARTIQTLDPLYAAAAGGGEVPCLTWPCWYTRVREAPRELRWSDATPGDWKVTLKPDGQSSISLGVTSSNAIGVPEEVRARLSSGMAVVWKMTRPGEREPRSRAVFFIEPEAVPAPPAQALSWSEVLEIVPGKLQAELYDELLSDLGRFDEATVTGLAGFMSGRVRAAVFRAMADRLNGPPYWLGDPEGVWATDAARQALGNAWASIGVTYRD